MLLLTDANIARACNSWLELRRGFRLQVVVIRALILREVRTRFGKDRLGYLWAVLEPCLYIGIWLLLYTWLRMGTMIHDMSPVLFMAGGIIPFLAFRRVASFVESAISANTSLLQFPLVKCVDTFMARFILEASTQIFVAAIIFSAIILSGAAGPPSDIFDLLVASAGLLLLGFGFGVFNCTVEALVPFYGKCTPSILRILFWTSGVFFLVDKFPAPVQEIMNWNPVLHGIELFRSAWSHTYETRIGSIWYILTWASGLFLVGLILERSARREILEQ